MEINMYVGACTLFIHLSASLPIAALWNIDVSIVIMSDPKFSEISAQDTHLAALEAKEWIEV